MRDDDRDSDQARRKKRIRAANAARYGRQAKKYNKPANSTTGAYDVASRSGPGASHYPVPDYINENRRGRGQVGRGPYGPPKLDTPENSTTGVYDVALRSGPGAPEFPYGPPNGPRNPSRTVNWRSSPTRGSRPPQSERATNRGSSGSGRQSGHGGYNRPNTSKSGVGRNYSSKERGAAQNLARIAQNVLKRGR